MELILQKSGFGLDQIAEDAVRINCGIVRLVRLKPFLRFYICALCISQTFPKKSLEHTAVILFFRTEVGLHRCVMQQQEKLWIHTSVSSKLFVFAKSCCNSQYVLLCSHIKATEILFICARFSSLPKYILKSFYFSHCLFPLKFTSQASLLTCGHADGCCCDGRVACHFAQDSHLVFVPWTDRPCFSLVTTVPVFFFSSALLSLGTTQVAERRMLASFLKECCATQRERLGKSVAASIANFDSF